VVSAKHLKLANRMRELLAVYSEAEDLINIGAYQRGNNPKIDEALDYIDAINHFLLQQVKESYTLEQTVNLMEEVLGTVS